MVRLHMIVAYCKPNKGIGYKNKLPWHLPCDLKRFKELTKNGTLITGRHTYESLPLDKFKDREIAVITRNETIPNSFPTFSQCYQHYYSKLKKHDPLWIIGGSVLYEYVLKHHNVHKLFITEIHKHFRCDTYFRGFHKKHYYLMEKQEGIENGIPYVFKTYTDELSDKDDVIHEKKLYPYNQCYYIDSFHSTTP